MAVRTVPNYLRVHIRYGVAIAMLLLALLLTWLPIVRAFENTLYDLRVRLAVANDTPHPDMVVVEISEASLDHPDTLTGWPWPRLFPALILDYCSRARVTGVDIIYAEPQWVTEANELGDRPLIKYAQSNGEVYMAALFHEEIFSGTPEPEGLAKLALTVDEGAGRDILSFDGALVPFPALMAKIAGVGHTNLERDADSVMRTYQAVVKYRKKLYPSLALVLAARYLDIDPTTIRLDAGNCLHLGDRRMQLSPRGGFLFSPLPQEVYSTYDSWDLIDCWRYEYAGETPSIEREVFDGKIVLFGMTAETVRDHEITPLPGATPGVLIHAAAVQNFLTQTSFRTTSERVQIVFMIVLAVLPALPRLERPRALLLLGFGLLLVYVVANFGFALYARQIAPLMGPVLANGLSCAALQGMYWGQERARRKYFETLEVAKQQFTDMLVHDLKNTVAPIVMSLTLVDDKLDLNEELTAEDIRFWRKDFPEIVATSSNKLMTQINALLDIRRMQEGRLQLHPAAHDPDRLIQRVAEQYRVAAERTDLRIEITERVGAGPQVYVDAEVFDRILGNLVWNAVKYAKQHTAIEIGARLSDKDTMEFYVANHGRPIPQEAQEHLFMAFVSGREMEKERKAMPSTGLGLTFCKLAAEAHGGDIVVRSPILEGGDGVVAIARLPRAKEDAPIRLPG